MTTKVTFILPSEIVGDASEGLLLGEFNNWNQSEAVKLQKKEDGSMVAEIALIAGNSYQYRYLLNDGRWVNDYNGKATTHFHGQAVENCVVHVAANAIAAEEKVVAKQAAAKKAPAKKAPAKKAKAEKPVAEDLTKIEGIGKKIAALLKKAGIVTYKELSKSSAKSLKDILIAGGDQFNMHTPGSRPKQPKLAATGKWEELKKLQDELNAGK